MRDNKGIKLPHIYTPAVYTIQPQSKRVYSPGNRDRNGTRKLIMYNGKWEYTATVNATRVRRVCSSAGLRVSDWFPRRRDMGNRMKAQRGRVFAQPALFARRG